MQGSNIFTCQGVSILLSWQSPLKKNIDLGTNFIGASKMLMGNNNSSQNYNIFIRYLLYMCWVMIGQ